VERNFWAESRALESLHLAFPPPRRLMRILSSIILPSPALMVPFDPKIPIPEPPTLRARRTAM
jgi:hypothetical protein